MMIISNTESPSKLWRLNPSWLEVVPVESKCTTATEEYWQFNSGASNPLIEWEVIKEVIWGVLIYVMAFYRAELRETGLILERKVMTTESAFVD